MEAEVAQQAPASAEQLPQGVDAGHNTFPGQMSDTPAPQQLNLDNIDAKTLDSAEGFKVALTKAATEAGVEDPNLVQRASEMVVAAPDGTVDVEKTFIGIAHEFNTAMIELVKVMEDLLVAYEKAMRSPEFKKFDLATKKSVKEAAAELKVTVAKMKKNAQAIQAQQAQQAPTQSQPVSEELSRILSIAGLK